MSLDEALKTPLFSWHQTHGGRLVEFGGWLMPVQYSTIVEEHRAVRDRVGLFDISHMGRLSFRGEDRVAWIEYLTTNHVGSLAVDQIQYSLMANGGGGLIDDILVYRAESGHYIVCNASNRNHVLNQFDQHRGERQASLDDLTFRTAMIAVQGPFAKRTLEPLLDGSLAGLRYYRLLNSSLNDGTPAIVSRTGYTGEDGYELIIPADTAETTWVSLLKSGEAHGIVPCGLGARDTLRFEAAMPLYGHELDEATNPYAAGLGWAVKLEKGDFIGREALERFKSHPGQTRVGLALEGKRIARQGAEVFHEADLIGVVTSGTFSPTLQQSLAMALVDSRFAGIGTRIDVDIRGRREPASVVSLPFYQGKKLS